LTPSDRSPRRLLAAALSAVAAVSCSGPQTPSDGVPEWSTANVDFGQGQIVVGVRYRWVAERDVAGVVIRTPDGGEALVRVFSCGRSRHEVETALRHRLRGRLIGNELNPHGPKIFSLGYWRGKLTGESAAGGTKANAAVVLHGPLLISVSASNLELADLVGVAQRVRLNLPLPTIPGCFPVCDVEGAKCVPQSSEDEG
jgi:hypothetical protein